MLGNLSRLLVPAILLGVTLTLAGKSRADVLYVQAGVQGTYARSEPPTRVDYGDYWNTGMTSASASGAEEASIARAFVSLQNDPGIRLEATGLSDTFDNTFQSSVVQWRDIIRVIDAPTPPSQLRLTFSATGNLGLDPHPVDPFHARAEAQVYVRYFGRFEDGLITETPEIAATAGGSGILFRETINYDEHANPIRDPYLEASAVDNFSYDPGNGTVSWDSSFILPFSELSGGFSINFLFTNRSFAHNGYWLTSDFGSTFRLSSVTLPDGSPVTGTLAFDSGFQLTAVPEPSSLALGVIGAGAGLCGWWRRKRRVA